MLLTKEGSCNRVLSLSSGRSFPQAFPVFLGNVTEIKTHFCGSDMDVLG